MPKKNLSKNTNKSSSCIEINKLHGSVGEIKSVGRDNIENISNNYLILTVDGYLNVFSREKDGHKRLLNLIEEWQNNPEINHKKRMDVDDLIEQLSALNNENWKEFVNPKSKKYSKLKEVLGWFLFGAFIQNLVSDYFRSIQPVNISNLTDENSLLQEKSKSLFEYVGIGEAYRKLLQTENALKTFDQAIKSAPNQSEIYTLRGRVFLSSGNNLAGMEDLNKAIQLNPEDQFSLLTRGKVLLNSDDYNAAIVDFNKVLELEPNSIEVLALRGEVSRQLGDFPTALQDFNNALSLDPDDAWLYALQGETYLNSGNFDHALDSFNKAIDLNADLSWVYASRAQAYMGVGNAPHALIDLEQAKELDSSSNELNDHLDDLNQHFPNANTEYDENITVQPQSDTTDIFSASKDLTPDDLSDVFPSDIIFPDGLQKP